MDNAFITGNQLTSLASNHKGSDSYCDEIEDKYPGFIHKMYRYAENVLSNQASVEQLAALMNEKSETEEGFPTLASKKCTIWKWFRNQEGKECSPMEKPFLAEDQKKNRMRWAMQELKRLFSTDFYCDFFDEKCFTLQVGIEKSSVYLLCKERKQALSTRSIQRLLVEDIL
eukprot:14171071-Ditylum_brightwellii.AAC.1